VTAPDRIAAFRDDIAASSGALTRLLDGWRAPDLRGRRRFLFAGLGSSRYAALVVVGPVRAAGGTAWVEYAGGDTPGAPSEDLVAVCISASGKTPEVLATAERYAGRALVVAVTNQPEGALAGRADVVVPLDAGVEASGIAGRTFRATIAALGLLAGVVTVDELRPAADGLAERLADPRIDAAVDDLDGAPSIDVVAAASALGIAEQAALMLREAPRLPARAYETADWLHTGVYLALPGHRVVLLPGSPADDEVVTTVERRGGRIVRLPGRDVRRGQLAEAIVASLVPERLAADLWQRATGDDKAP
jgi:glucosamine--fructose-6-phosphate aminotransferase (isomerizing)